MKNEKRTWVFVLQKYGKFDSVWLGHFTKHKPLISEECMYTQNISYIFHDFSSFGFVALVVLCIYVVIYFVRPKEEARK